MFEPAISQPFKIVSSSMGKVEWLVTQLSLNPDNAIYKPYLNSIQKHFPGLVTRTLLRPIALDPVFLLGYTKTTGDTIQSMTDYLKSIMDSSEFAQLNAAELQTMDKWLDNALNLKSFDTLNNYINRQQVQFPDSTSKLIAQSVKKRLETQLNDSLSFRKAYDIRIVLLNRSNFSELTSESLDADWVNQCVRKSTPSSCGSGGVWIQDNVIALQDTQQCSELLYSSSGCANAGSFETLYGQPKVGFQTTNIGYLQGGNFLAQDDFVLIGSDVLIMNFKDSGRTDFDKYQQELEDSLKEYLGIKKIYWVYPFWNSSGTSNNSWKYLQEIFHIDLFITLLGKTKEGKHLILLGEINDTAAYYCDQSAWLAKTDTSLYKKRKNAIYCLKNYLKSVKTFFESDTDFKVVSIPLVVVFRRTALDSYAKPYFNSYNNAIVEIDGNQKRIVMPKFKGTFPNIKSSAYVNYQIVEDTIKARLKPFGFKIEFIGDDCEELTNAGGVLHCASKVLLRD